MDPRAAFFAAIQANRTDEVSRLLATGLSPRERTDEGLPALALAARERHCEVARLLIARGASVDERDARQRTPLLVAVEGPDPDAAPQKNALGFTRILGTEVLAVLLEHGADANAADVEGITPLMLMARDGFFGPMKLLVEKHGARVDEKDEKGRTALAYAVMGDRPGSIEYLAGRGADVNAPDARGASPVMQAIQARAGRTIIEALMKAGADLALRDAEGRTALQIAQRSGRHEEVFYLIEAGAWFDAKGEDADALLCLAAGRGHARAVRLLLEAGVSATGTAMQSPLHLAVASGHEEVVGALLAGGADPNRADPGGQVPLLIAIRRGGRALTERLLDAGADAGWTHPTTGESAPAVAVSAGCFDLLPLLGARGANLRGQQGELDQALIRAVKDGLAAGAGILVDAGADVNVLGPQGRTPLLTAAANGDWAMVGALLDRGADASRTDQAKDTALTLVARAEVPAELIWRLLDGGVPLEGANSLGATPLLLAATASRRSTVDVLLERGADPTRRDLRGRCAQDVFSKPPPTPAQAPAPSAAPAASSEPELPNDHAARRTMVVLALVVAAVAFGWAMLIRRWM